MRRIEFSLIFLFILTLVMFYTSIPGARQLVYFSTACAVLFYLIFGIGISRRTFFISALKQAHRGEKPLIWMKTAGMLIFALSLVTFLGHELYWRYRDILLYSNVLLLTALMFFSLFLLERREPALHKFIIWRAAIASAVIVYYTIVPIKTRLEWQYDDQYYREILLFAIENPTDEDAQKAVQDYDRRLNGQPLIDSSDAIQGVEETQE